MKILERALERFSIPPESIGAGRLILSGESYLSLENHRGLLEYAPDNICLSRSGGFLRVRGEGLEIAAMETGSVVIKGKILSIELG